MQPKTGILGTALYSPPVSRCNMFCVDSANQTVIINESTSSDGSAAAQLWQRACQFTALPAVSQPAITSTSSAPDVCYTEPRIPIVDSADHSADSNFVPFSECAAPPWQAPVLSHQDVGKPRIPAYRPAPDYNSVMQQRLLSQYYAHPYVGQDCTSFSQPDIYQHSAVASQLGHGATGMPAAYAVHAADRANSLMIPESVAVCDELHSVMPALNSMDGVWKKLRRTSEVPPKKS